MTGSTKQNRSEPARSNRKCRTAKPGHAVGKTAASQPGADATDADRTLVDGCDEEQVRSKVGAWSATEQWQEDLQSTEYIEGRTLRWIKQLEQIADLALRPQDDRAWCTG